MSHFQVEKKMSNNVNKALVIDYSDSRLISCGSLFQGNTNKNFAPLNFFAPLLHFFLHHCLSFFPMRRSFSRPRGKKLGANGLVSDGLVIPLPLTLTCRPLCPLCAHIWPVLSCKSAHMLHQMCSNWQQEENLSSHIHCNGFLLS